MEATTTRASILTRSIPTSATRSQASMTIPLSRTRSRISMGWAPRVRSTITGVPSSYRDGQRAIDLDGHAPRHEIDGEDEQTLVRPAAHEDAFHVGHRPAGDPHPLPFLQERIRQRREPAAHHPLDGVDLPRWHGRALLPAVAQDRHQAPRLAALG